MSDTPRTNRVTRARSEIASTSVVDSDFARTLERELSAAQNEVERLREALQIGLRYFGGDSESVVMAIVEDGSTLKHFQDAARRALNPVEEGKS